MKRYWLVATAGLLITILESGCQPNNLPMPTETAVPTAISTPTPTSTPSPIPTSTATPTNIVVPTNTATMSIGTASSSQRIVFSRLTTLTGDYLVDLYMVNSDGSELTNISNNPKIDEFNPVWLPDGSGVQFLGSPHGTNTGKDLAIYQIRLDGSLPPVMLAALPLDASLFPLVSWSPDLSHIAFSVMDDLGLQLHAMGVDGTGEVNLGSGAYPSWSPDSTALVFTSLDESSLGLKMVDLSGNPIAFSSSIRASNSLWSPLGDKFACFCEGPDKEGATPIHFCIFDGEGNHRIWVANAFELADSIPSWSPDGAYIAVANNMTPPGDPAGAYLLGIGDSEFTEIHMSPQDSEMEIVGGPTWSPDSLKWAFPCTTVPEGVTLSPLVDPLPGICIFDMRTRTITQITHEMGILDMHLDWEP